MTPTLAFILLTFVCQPTQQLTASKSKTFFDIKRKLEHRDRSSLAMLGSRRQANPAALVPANPNAPKPLQLASSRHSLASQLDVARLGHGDTAWMLTACALVLFMTLPGLALFYGGLVQKKNVVSVLVQCLVITCLVTLLWLVFAYSLAFAEGSFILGGVSKAFFKGVTATALVGAIPESVFALYQLTFAIITPCIIVGGFAERLRFQALLLFTTFWVLAVYCPIAHAVWGGGFLMEWGCMDFAGGLVVHTSSAVSALVAAMLIGKREDTEGKPHNVTMTFTGASMLWVGWFGFNAGSALAANALAGMAALVTQVAAAAAAFAWMFTEWAHSQTPSSLGLAAGAVAGLVAITPASGFVGPGGALVIGLAAGIICYGAQQVGQKLAFVDDYLDVFPVHGIGGAVGTILTGIFASESLGVFSGVGYASGRTMASQVGVQAASLCFAYVWAGVGTFIILKGLDLTVGLRVTAAEEALGLDEVQHQESGYWHKEDARTMIKVVG